MGRPATPDPENERAKQQWLGGHRGAALGGGLGVLGASVSSRNPTGINRGLARISDPGIRDAAIHGTRIGQACIVDRGPCIYWREVTTGRALAADVAEVDALAVRAAKRRQ